jgi:hypothetical protein
MVGPNPAPVNDFRDGGTSGPSPPGYFVSDEHRSDCARFLDDVKRLVNRRHLVEVSGPGVTLEPPHTAA